MRGPGGRRLHAAISLGTSRPVPRLAGLVILGVAGGAAESLAVLLVVGVAAGPRGLHLPLHLLAGASTRTRGIAALGAVLALGLVHLTAAWVTAQVGSSSLRALRSDVVDAYLAASWSGQSADHAGEVQELVTACAPRVAFAAEQMSVGIGAALNTLIVVVTAAVVDVWALTGLAVIAAVTLSVVRPSRRAAQRYAERAAQANAELAVEMAEAVALNREIRVFDTTGAMRRRIHDRIDRTSESFAAAQFVNKATPNVARDAVLAALVIGVAALASGARSLADIGVVMVLLLRGATQAQAAAGTVNSLADLSTNLDRLDSYVGRWTAARSQGGRLACPESPTIELQSVCYRYPPGAREQEDGRTWALEDVELRLAPGEQIGLVGPSGAGKSTLAAILLGTVTPQRGRVLVDGQDLTDLDTLDWYGRVAWVPQEPRLLTGTVAENIRFFRTDISDDALLEAARRVGLDVSGWPGGLERPVGPAGIAMSGGERQRVALARALAGSPDLIVLDEPTSALDELTEDVIRRSLAELAGSVTVVIIAHRAALLSSCTRIIEVKDGRIAEAAVTGPSL